MYKGIEDREKLPGTSRIVIDVSGSMNSQMSGKSQMTRMDAACGLAILAREICEKVEIYTFSYDTVAVPLRRGFALRDAVVRSQQHGGTYMGKSISKLNSMAPADRTIVFTDEQSADHVPAPVGRGYIVNVASCQNGVGYGEWTHINGFSESIIDYIIAYERSSTDER
jgi:hypothetical protein